MVIFVLFCMLLIFMIGLISGITRLNDTNFENTRYDYDTINDTVNIFNSMYKRDLPKLVSNIILF